MVGKATGKPAWTPEDFAALDEFMTRFNRELAESGELVETRGLDAPVHTRRVGGSIARRRSWSDRRYAGIR